ncbi:hypothetical protein FQZ97_1018580 [compost metagenome]
MLPQRSVAVHFLVNIYDDGQFPSVLVSAKITVAVPQASVAVSVAAAGILSQDAASSAAGNVPANTGA